MAAMMAMDGPCTMMARKGTPTGNVRVPDWLYGDTLSESFAVDIRISRLQYNIFPCHVSCPENTFEMRFADDFECCSGPVRRRDSRALATKIR